MPPVPGQWFEIPNTHMRDVQPTQAEVDAIAPNLWSDIKGHTWPGRLSDWTSLGFDPELRKLFFPFAGGHADYGGTNGETIGLNDAAPAWVREFPILPLDGPVQGSCPGPTYGSPARHTYDCVTYLQDGVFFFGGGGGYCKSGVGAKMAYFLDTRTPFGSYPWTLTEFPALKPYTGTSALSAVHGDHLYLYNSSKIARVDRLTGALLASATRSFGFNSSIGACGISPDGLLCVADVNNLCCMNVVGTFGQWVARPVGANAPVGSVASLVTGYMSMTPLGDSGWFAMWRGDKRVIFFKPGAGNDPQLDEWDVFDPATGPTDGTSGRCYGKIFWDASICSLVGYSNVDEGVWLLPVSDVGCTITPPEEEEPTIEAAPDEGDYGPSPNATLASLALRADTLLADPLDDTPIMGPAIREDTPYLRLSEVVEQPRYGKWRWANVKTHPITGLKSPVLDTEVKVPGSAGSLRFNIFSQSGAGGGGDYDVNVTPDYYANNPEMRVLQGDTIRMRYKVRFSTSLLFTDCTKQTRRDYLGSGGFKVGAIGEADFPGEVIDGGEGLGIPVFSNYKERGFLAGYISQWNLNISKKIGTVNGISYFDLQPGGCKTCLSHEITGPNAGGQYNPADPNCFMLDSEQWYTCQEDLYYGQPLQFDDKLNRHSHVKWWIAPEGQPFTLMVDHPINLKRSNLQGDTLPTLGRIGISAFMTGKNNTEVHPDAYIWYDDLWVAKVQ